MLRKLMVRKSHSREERLKKVGGRAELRFMVRRHSREGNLQR